MPLKAPIHRGFFIFLGQQKVSMSTRALEILQNTFGYQVFRDQQPTSALWR